MLNDRTLKTSAKRNLKIDFDLLINDDSNKKTIDVDHMDRTTAILIYKGQVYEDDNHQYAFKQAIEDEGKTYHWDIENDITHEDKAAEETYTMSLNQEIYTFSIFEDKHNTYIIAHFENYLTECLYLLEAYLKKGYILGSYKDIDTNECYVFEKINNL